MRSQALLHAVTGPTTCGHRPYCMRSRALLHTAPGAIANGHRPRRVRRTVTGDRPRHMRRLVHCTLVPLHGMTLPWHGLGWNAPGQTPPGASAAPCARRASTTRSGLPRAAQTPPAVTNGTPRHVAVAFAATGSGAARAARTPPSSAHTHTHIQMHHTHIYVYIYIYIYIYIHTCSLAHFTSCVLASRRSALPYRYNTVTMPLQCCHITWRGSALQCRYSTVTMPLHYLAQVSAHAPGRAAAHRAREDLAESRRAATQVQVHLM